MAKYEIEVGDFVDVIFNCSKVKLGGSMEVIYKPQATGDSWIFKDDANNIHYVSEGCTITKYLS